MMKTAFLFPGQGSQHVNMLAPMIEAFPSLMATYEHASDILGHDMYRLSTDESKINQTQFTQPLLLTASVALYQLWLDEGGQPPQIMAGHSLGEYSALCCGGAFTFEQALKLVEARGRFMQTAVAPGTGAMAAVIGPTNDEIEVLCRRVGSEGVMISPANYNAQGQVVVSGHLQAIRLMIELGHQERFKVIPLSVSVPSHSVLMTPAAKQLQQLFKVIEPKVPKIPTVHNIDVEVYDDPEAIKNALVNQLCYPVKWSQTMDYLYEQGVDSYIECGPGKVLSGLGRRQKNKVSVTTLDGPEAFKQALVDHQS